MCRQPSQRLINPLLLYRCAAIRYKNLGTSFSALQSSNSAPHITPDLLFELDSGQTPRSGARYYWLSERSCNVSWRVISQHASLAMHANNLKAVHSRKTITQNNVNTTRRRATISATVARQPSARLADVSRPCLSEHARPFLADSRRRAPPALSSQHHCRSTLFSSTNTLRTRKPE